MAGVRLLGPRHRLALIQIAVLLISAMVVPLWPVQGSSGRSRTDDGGAGPVEILGFDVPATVRAGERFSATALIFNNGSALVRDLWVYFRCENNTVNYTQIHLIGPYNSSVAYIEMWTWDTEGKTVQFSVQASGREMSVLRRVQPPFGKELVIRSFNVTPERFEVDQTGFEKELTFRVELENRADHPINVTILVNDTSIDYGKRGPVCSVPVTVNASSVCNYTNTFIYRSKTSSYGGFHQFTVRLSNNSTGGASDLVYVSLKPTPFAFQWAPFLLTLTAILLVVSGATIYIFLSARKRKGH
jgi:hypothetical protein